MSRAISFQRVGFSYPEGPPALVDAEFEIDAGSFVLVCGATGSGKSTLLRAINGLVPHFTGGSFVGRVMVCGRDTLEHPPRELADVVGFVPQNPSASFVLDIVEDEIAYALENLGIDGSTMRRRVEEALDLLAIEPLRARSLRSLSGGERQRVAIASVLVTGPKVLVLDEPTSQLDPQGAEDVLAALQRMVHDLGITVVLAEHRLERVAGFADIAVGVARGAAPRVGPPASVIPLVTDGPPVADLGRILGWDPLPLTVRAARTFEAPVLPVVDAAPVTRAEPILVARSLVAKYGDHVAVSNVDLALGPGEIVAIAGRNGSGKTTLLRCLVGLHEPSSGRVDFHDRVPVPGRDVALLPQTPDVLLFSDSVRSEIEATISASDSGLDGEQIIGALGIAELSDRHPRDLSAGERLLVAVGAIAATGAPALLLDEPTRGLDPDSKKRLKAFLEDWSSKGRVVALATHDVELAAEIAQRVVMLASGEVIAEGSPEIVLGDSPVFAPQTARVLGPLWLTPGRVAAALGLAQA